MPVLHPAELAWAAQCVRVEHRHSPGLRAAVLWDCRISRAAGFGFLIARITSALWPALAPQGGDTASQGFGVSTGGTGVGRSVRTGGAQAFTWTQGGGIVGLPNLAARPFCVSNAANNTGAVETQKGRA